MKGSRVYPFMVLYIISTTVGGKLAAFRHKTTVMVVVVTLMMTATASPPVTRFKRCIMIYRRTAHIMIPS